MSEDGSGFQDVSEQEGGVESPPAAESAAAPPDQQRAERNTLN